MEKVINRRGPVRDRKNQSYIVTDSGAEMVTMVAGWLITERGDMPSINIAGPCQQMGIYICTGGVESLGLTVPTVALYLSGPKTMP